MFSVGQRVEVYYGGAWRTGTVSRVNDREVAVHGDGMPSGAAVIKAVDCEGCSGDVRAFSPNHRERRLSDQIDALGKQLAFEREQRKRESDQDGRDRLNALQKAEDAERARANAVTRAEVAEDALKKLRDPRMSIDPSNVKVTFNGVEIKGMPYNGLIKVESPSIDHMIGRLDRLLSEFLLASEIPRDEADRQTLKHHAEDLIGVGNAALDKLKKIGVKS